MVDFRINRKLRFLSIFLVLNIFGLLIDLHAQDATSNEYISNQEKECLDVNKINSSVDAGSFYSVDLSIKQLEENMAKIVQELTRLKQHVEFARMAEQKKILQIQKLEKEVQQLEKENMKFRQSWLNNSLDNSWTGSSSRMEALENKSHDVAVTTTATVKQPEPAQTVAPVPVLQTATPQAVTPQVVTPEVATQPAVRQDVIVQVVGDKDN